MITLREAIETAEKRKVAIGHFNISTIEALWAIAEAAKELKVPVIIGVSEGERHFLGVRQMAVLVKSIREEYGYEGNDYPIFLNADHTYSFQGVKEAIDAGYDAVIFDGAKLSLEENIRTTKQCVEYAHSISNGKNVLVEGELGYIGQSSEVFDTLPLGFSENNMTTPEEAKRFVEETGVQLFAPAVGNMHGMLRDMNNPALDIPRIKKIRESAGVPLVLHGGSGITDDDFTKAIDAGISVIHINTEIRAAWRHALGVARQEDIDTVAPYKILKSPKEAVRKVVLERLKLFNNL